MDKLKLDRYISENPDIKLGDAVARILYEDIIALHIPPGAKLNVNQIAAALGISRTPVVDAIEKLTADGFIVSHPGISGSYVQDLSLKDMMSLYRARSAIEGEAAALCAHNVDDATIVRLEELAVEFKDSLVRKDLLAMRDTDIPFHRMLIDNCGNEYMQQCYHVLLPKLTMYQSSMMEILCRESTDDNPWAAKMQYNHIAVASAIRLRMPDLARQSMEDHVTASMNFTTIAGHGDPFVNISAI